ncbi:MAG: hypothetical protein JL50_03725 [Peptococcaceae bacterium BICA1-7]|nr:MAG: hypothetical protein JL50_03725 [Peptococcaceae bacterium BICA1-7]HBV97624.1 hypothetical protein [Desulfotomaculum sp.]
MNKLPIDMDTLPEPIKSMVQSLDPQMIENMLAMYDPATMSLMMNSVFAMLKDTLPPDQLEGIKEMMDNLLKIMPQKE